MRPTMQRIDTQVNLLPYPLLSAVILGKGRVPRRLGVLARLLLAREGPSAVAALEPARTMPAQRWSQSGTRHSH